MDKLKNLCQKYDKNCLKYADTFEKFRKVVNSCFSVELKPGYENDIDDFKKSYEKLNISVTIKIHAIFFHVKEFCRKYGKGLGFFSEQAFETVHHDFEETWQNFRRSEELPSYGKKLLRAVCTYNCGHL